MYKHKGFATENSCTSTCNCLSSFIVGISEYVYCKPLDEISAAYVCLWGMAQKGNDLVKSKETSRLECAKKCHGNSECVGFEYKPKSADCFLTKTSWREFAPTGLTDWWSCEKKEGKTIYSVLLF